MIARGDGRGAAELRPRHTRSSTPRQRTAIRAAAERVGREVAILGDLPGPKLRLGPVAGGVAELARDSRVVLTAREVEGTAERLPVAWPGFSELVDEGDVCYLADGAVGCGWTRSQTARW